MDPFPPVTVNSDFCFPAFLVFLERERERERERSYETNFEAAAERKEEKYEELVTGAYNTGYETELITLEVGSRGVINPAGFQLLKSTLNCTSREIPDLMLQSCK